MKEEDKQKIRELLSNSGLSGDQLELATLTSIYINDATSFSEAAIGVIGKVFNHHAGLQSLVANLLDWLTILAREDDAFIQALLSKPGLGKTVNEIDLNLRASLPLLTDVAVIAETFEELIRDFGLLSEHRVPENDGGGEVSAELEELLKKFGGGIKC